MPVLFSSYFSSNNPIPVVLYKYYSKQIDHVKLWIVIDIWEISALPNIVEMFRHFINIVIQRGNAASIFATVPTSNKLQEIYYL